MTTSTAIEVNAVTANGFTAWDILAQSKRDIKDWDIGELLRRAGAISAKDLQLPANELAVTQTNSVTSHENKQKHEGKKDLKETPSNLDDWLEEKRNAAMIVASVIASMCFQAAVNPPQSREPHISFFVFCNTIGFVTSATAMGLLLCSPPFNRIICVFFVMECMGAAIVAMGGAYAASINVIGDYSTFSAMLYVWMVAVPVFVLLFFYALPLMVKMIRRRRKSIRRPSHIQAQDGRDNEPPIASTV